MCSMDDDDVLDMRSIVPAQRHAMACVMYGQLEPGTSMVFVNDHDPQPLRRQLDNEYPQQVSWTYLEKGPEVWRVEVGKSAEAV